MKNKTWLLTKTLLKNGEGFGIKGMKNKVGKILMTMLLLVVFPGMVVLLSLFVNTIYSALFMLGQEGIIISWGIAATSLIIFLFGIFYISGSFYFTKDIETLLPLPLKPRQIVGAKFLTVAIYEYFITAAIFLPVMIIYGVRSGAGALYYLYGTVVFAFIPIVPLALSAMLIMILMRFTNMSRHKDAFNIVSGLLALVLALGLNAVLPRFMVQLDTGELEELLMRGENSLAVLLSGIFPTARWAVVGLLESTAISGFLNILLYAVVSCAVYGLILILGENLYFKGVIGINESRSKRGSKKGSKEIIAVKGSVLKTYTLIELKLLFRTPIYFLNCVIINFLWPFLLILTLITGELDTEMDVDLFAQMVQFFTNPAYSGALLLGGFSVFIFMGGFNAVVSTAISREGQELFIKKYIPVHYRVQIMAKVLSGFILGFAGAILMLVVALILFKIPLTIVLLILVTGWLGIFLSSFTGILIDLYNPKLNWDSEIKAVKQNLNVIYNMLIALVLGGPALYIAIAFTPTIATAFLVIAAYAVLVGFMYSLLGKQGVKRFGQLEG